MTKVLMHILTLFFVVFISCDFNKKIPPMADPILLSAEITHVQEYGQATGAIELSVVGGISPYSYTWSNDEYAKNIRDLVAGLYTVVVIDSESSNVTDTYEVTQPDAPIPPPLPPPPPPPVNFIIDHNDAFLSNIPLEWITAAKIKLHIAYEHTSHGSQIVEGMTGLYKWKGNTYAFNSGGVNGALDFRDHAISPWRWSDIGTIRDPNNYVYNTYDWARITRTYLNNSTNSEINVVMWAWCGQVSTISEADIHTYLNEMEKLEKDYPNVKFVYMTGHVDGTSPTSVLYRNNAIIRKYCLDNNKILYDFAEIESYDPDGNYYGNKRVTDCGNYDYNGDGVVSTDGGDPGYPVSPDRNWALDWQKSHTLNVDWFQCESAHAFPLTANRKAYAAWHLWARLAGWDGN